MPQSPEQPDYPARVRHGLTPKGRRTRRALLEAARQVFEHDGYYRASVAEIGRRCEVSQGTFYQYFGNKDQIFREIIDTVLMDFWQKAATLEASEHSGEAALGPVLELLLAHCRDHAALHRVLNEYELIQSATISYFDSLARFLRQFFRRAMNQGWLRLLDPNVVAYSLIGMAVFQHLDWGQEPTPRTLPQLSDMCKDLLLQGISGQKAWRHPRDLAAPTVPGDQVDANELRWQETEGAGNRTKRAIFQAAEQAFGQYGYSRAQISEITRRAGVAQGTFYVHFRSKEDLLDGVVRFLSHELRRTLRGITSQARDRRDREREGMIAFFHFIRRHSRIYRIVAESEAIVPESARYYYRKLDQSYQRSLSPGMQRGELRELPLDFLAHSLMGLNHMIGLRWLIWNAASGLALPGPVLHDAVDLVFFGLRMDS